MLYLLFCIYLTIPSAHAQPPHILVILADDLGYNDVSWHNPAVLTPNLAKLASEGVTLEQHYSQPICSPTRGALLTGKYPIHNGLHNGVIQPLIPYGLDTSLTLLPEELRRANYSTHIVGKWHLGFCNKKFWPTNRGFDHHYGFMNGGQSYFTHTRDEGYDFWDDEEVAFSENGTYSTNLIQDRAVEVISKHDASKPLFLYLPFQSVHGPLEVPDVYRDMYNYIDDEDRQMYLGMVTAMDDAVGNITEALKSSNLYDNSVILWFSDNGGPIAGWPPGHETAYGANNWPLRGSKYTMWEGGSRTPAFIHSPSYLTPRVSTNWMHVTDWFPTILSMAGLSPSSTDLDGLDQWTPLQNASLPSPRTEMIYNIFYPYWDLSGGPPLAAIRVGDWKYIHRTVGYAGWEEAPETGHNKTEGDPNEDISNVLYNIATDPEEKENLYDTETEVVDDLRARLDQYIAALPEGSYPPKDEAGKPENFGGIWNAGWC